MTKFTAILALLLLLSPVAMARKTGPSGEPPTPPPGALGYGYWRYFDGGSGRQVFEWVEPGGYVLGTAITERGYGARDQWARSGAEMHWSPYLWLRGITGEQETNLESNHQRLVGVVPKGWR